MAAQNLAELLKACKRDGMVKMWPDALDDARDHFQLSDLKDVVRFLKYEIPKDWKEINSVPLDSDNTKMVHAYSFSHKGKLGYMAFFQDMVSKKWTIKSFKLHYLDQSKTIGMSAHVNQILRASGMKGKLLLGGGG